MQARGSGLAIMTPQRTCRCGSGLTPRELFDAQRIYIGRVCDQCEPRVRSQYRPEIFAGYNQADVDEPIEPDDAA